MVKSNDFGGKNMKGVLALILVGLMATVALANVTSNTQSNVSVGSSTTNVPANVSSTQTTSNASTTVSEEVKCVFEGSDEDEKCTTEDGEFGCTGIGSCVAVVTGSAGDVLSWSSSCTVDKKLRTTIIGGNDTNVTFECKQNDDDGEEVDDEDEDEVSNEDETSDEGDSDEISVMGHLIGAEMRLVQLELAIERNILIGQRVMSHLLAEGKNTTELDSILMQLKDLKQQVHDLDPVSEDAVQEFVRLKHEARELSQQFKKIVHSMLSEEKIIRLRNSVSNSTNKKIVELGGAVKKKIADFNTQKLQKVYEKLDLNDSELDRLKEGDSTLKDIKEDIKEKMREVSEEEKRQLSVELKEQKIKEEIFRKAASEKIKEENKQLEEQNKVIDELREDDDENETGDDE